MSTQPVTLHPGMTTWRNERGVCCLRLAYEADPMKAAIPEYEAPQVLAALKEKGKDVKWSDRTVVEEIKKQKPEGLTPWAYLQYLNSPSPTFYLQETEIKFDATLGELVYFLYPEATLEKSFPIPETWTRYFVLDPHPGVPHYGLWVAVDPWGDGWAYREFWPSKMYGKRGNIPEDDNRVTPKEFIEVVAWLESQENPENVINGKAFKESIYKRIIDYAARSFGHTANHPDGDNQSNFQVFFEQALSEFGCDCQRFEDCIKEGDAGADTVNEWLKPREIAEGNGWVKKSKLHIFSDRCPELILQLQTNRKQKLTALQADKMDPTGMPVKKRNHATDCAKYWCASNPVFIDPTPVRSTWSPITKNIAY